MSTNGQTRPEKPDHPGKASRFSRQGPARYRILVGKRLSPTWSDRLAGMEIKPVNEDPSQLSVTQLEGILQDQAQLSGILNALHNMGFPLLSVQALEE